MPRLNLKGLHCPRPLLALKESLKDNQSVILTIDDWTARKNIELYCQQNGCACRLLKEEGKDITLQIDRQAVNGQPAASHAAAPNAAAGTAEKSVYDRKNIIVSSHTLGDGEQELGSALMNSFFYTLGRSERLPKKIVFINQGVWLTGVDSPVLDELRMLQQKGVEILSCGACVDYYFADTLPVVGEITNMAAIAAVMLDQTPLIHV